MPDVSISAEISCLHLITYVLLTVSRLSFYFGCPFKLIVWFSGFKHDMTCPRQRLNLKYTVSSTYVLLSMTLALTRHVAPSIFLSIPRGAIYPTPSPKV